MPTATCPICRQPAALEKTNAARPFCSDRCKWIDLSKWLGEDYTIPANPVPTYSPPGEGKIV